MVCNPSAGADEALGPFSFFRLINILSLSFIKINLLVSEKKIFEGFLPYMGMVAILVM